MTQRSSSSPPNQTVIRLVSGGLSPLLSTIALQPFDVVKTRLINLNTPISALTLCRNIIQQEGVLGLWRGGVPTLARVATGGALFFTLNSFFLGLNGHRGPDGRPRVQTALSGAAARGIALCVSAPLAVVKTRIEATAERRYKGVVDALITIGRREGIGGLYSGFWPMVARDVPYASLQVLFYTQLKALLTGHTALTTESPLVQWISGFGASTLALVITHPADVIKTRVQMDIQHVALKDLPRSGRLVAVARAVWQETGWRGFFRGLSARILKKPLTSAITWMTYEQVVQKMKGQTNL